MPSVWINIYIYMCVCVCVCVCENEGEYIENNAKKESVREEELTT
jgi:hypothetical protein